MNNKREISEAEQLRQKDLDNIRQMSSEEIIENLNEFFNATRIIMNANQVSGGFSGDAGIIYVGLCEMWMALENAIEWIVAQREDEEDEEKPL